MEEVTNVGGAVKSEEIDLTALTSLTRQKPVEEEKVVSPIDAAIIAAKNAEKGLVAKTEDLNQSGIRSITDSDERREEFNETVSEMQDTTEKAKKVYQVIKPTNEVETAEMMEEISKVVIDDNGNVIVPTGAKYIRPKVKAKDNTTGDDIYVIPTDNAVVAPAEATPDTDTSTDAEEKDDNADKANLISLLIDKTGLGSDVTFTAEEQMKMTVADQINLTLVDDQQLRSTKVKKLDTNISFMENVENYQISTSKTNMKFPLSGFAADMTGLSYGEFADITLDVSDNSTDYYDFDRINKKVSTIYNHMQNVTCGKFKDYDDFLRKFAWHDVSLATFGLLISTQPEIDSINMNCQKDNCKNTWIHNFRVRNILNFDNCTEGYLRKIDAIVNATGNELFKVAEDAPVRNATKIELPTSKFIVEIAPISCYQYMYGIIPLSKRIENMMVTKDEDGEVIKTDQNAKYLYLMLASSIITGFYFKNAAGEELYTSDTNQIFDILNTMIPPSDMQIIQELQRQSDDDYVPGFAIRDVECPRCHTKTEVIPISIDNLVFQLHQRLLSTNIIAKGFHLL